MPVKSEAQRRLMWSIATGHGGSSKGGPSKAVAEEFTKSDPGGKLPEKAKDDLEEISVDAKTAHDPKNGQFTEKGEFSSENAKPNGKSVHSDKDKAVHHGTSDVDKKSRFDPDGLIHSKYDNGRVTPRNVGKTNDTLGGSAKDMARSKWDTLKRLFVEWVNEEEKESEHAKDEQSPKVGDRISFVDDRFTDKGPAETSIVRMKDGNIGVQWDKDEFEDFPWSKLSELAKSVERGGKTIWMIGGNLHTAEDDLAPNGGIPTAASVLFGTPAGRVLFVKRAKTEENWPDTWSLPGGRVDEGEDAPTCAAREAKEEIGRDCAVDDLKEIERKKTDHGWQHVLYTHAVDDEFEPKLNGEHSEFAWRDINDPPLPLHPGVKASLDKLRDKAASAKDDGEETPDDDEEEAVDIAADSHLGPYPVKALREGAWAYDAHLLTTAARRARLAGRGDLARRAEAIRVREFGAQTQAQAQAQDNAFAFDRDSVRHIDDDGRMHVAEANISRANVCGYMGREINDVMRDRPGWKMLEPDRIYKLLRDPDELAKAVDSFNNLPILDDHHAVSADDHKPEHVIGSTGTDAKFDGDHLTNSLVFWAKPAIDDIESGSKKALSAAYRYLAKMEPGVHNGERFDGRMTNISGNHLAQVSRGRAGPSVVVGDAAPVSLLDQEWLRFERALCSFS